MKETGICPKCHQQNIKIIKDIIHSSAGGNITTAKNFITKNNTFLLTFYICKDCGYVEDYLDEEELTKLNSTQ